MASMPDALPFRDATHRMASPIRSTMTEQERDQVFILSRWQHGMAAALCLPPVLLVTMLVVAMDPSVPLWTRLTLPVAWLVLVWLPLRAFGEAGRLRRDLKNGYALTIRTEVQKRRAAWVRDLTFTYRVVLRRPKGEAWQRSIPVPQVIYRAAGAGDPATVTYLPLSQRVVVLRVGGFIYYPADEEVLPG